MTTITADCASEPAVASVCERAIAEHGRLDHFFANAGMVGVHLLNNTDPDEFMKVFEVNTLRYVARWADAFLYSALR